MPRLSEFFGVIITMYFNDHGPPHFHARYGNDEAKISIESLELLKGKLPRRALSLVLEWASEHRRELMQNWKLIQKGIPAKPIKPLR
ncbi:MAG: DUF4160 domain-containing protein [Bacteroidetes bacterium]|nr:MAG: DUF4160 domain-containing protein [Bacteroidota bacterium]